MSIAARRLITPSSIRTSFSKDPQNHGAKLEVDVYKETTSLGMFDYVIHEKDLVTLYGWQSSSIDQLMIIGEYMIPIQLKWRKTRRRETSGVANFVKSIQHIQNVMDKKVLFGIWSSRIEPFEDNIKWLKTENIVCVSSFESIESLVKVTLETITSQCSLYKDVVEKQTCSQM